MKIDTWNVNSIRSRRTPTIRLTVAIPTAIPNTRDTAENSRLGQLRR